MTQDRAGFYNSNELLLNLQPYWDEFGVDTSVWGSGLVDPYRIGDDLYAAPVNWDTIAIMYNKDMFDAAGLEYPTAEWTWDDFAAVAETVALLEQVDLHFGNDNGPMHFAIAAQKKTVAVFGRPWIANWSPPSNDRHLAIEYDPGCKSDCFYPKCGLECIRLVSADKVWDLITLHMSKQMI